ncbi:hypothetical protein TrVE_jg14284, partial [Triparma verrucosa]
GGAPAAAPAAAPVGGFTFGGAPAPTPVPAPAVSSTGFSFGSAAPAPGPAPAQSSSTSSSGGGFTFGSPAPKPPPVVSVDYKTLPTPDNAINRKITSSFGTSPPKEKEALSIWEAGLRASKAWDTIDPTSSTLPPSSMSDILSELGENFHGDELDAQIEKCTVEGKLSKEKFMSWYVDFLEEDDESVADSEIAEEKENAENAYDDVADDGVVKADDFDKLFEALGSTYDPDDHSRYLVKVKGSDGNIDKKMFVAWYVDWLFGDNEDDIGSDEEVEVEVEDEEKTTSAPTGSGWGNAFGKTSGWKCEVCMCVNIPEDKLACPACETVRPGKEKEVEASKPKSVTSASGVFAFGGVPAAASSSPAPTGGFTFGSAPAAAPASTGEFTFGSATATPAPAPASSSGFNFNSNSPAAPKLNFAFGSPTATTKKTDEDEDSEDEEEDEDYEEEEEDDDDEDEEDDEESSSDTDEGFVAPNPLDAKALDAWKTVAGAIDTKLPSSKMEDLLSELGENFHGEELDAQIEKCVQSGHQDRVGGATLQRDKFVKWYVDFCGDDDDESIADSEIAEEKENAENAYDDVADDGVV